MTIRLSNDELREITAKSGYALKPEDFPKHKPRGPGKSKYKAKATYVDGIWFQSRAEAARYEQLLGMVERGEIVGFHRQVIFDLGGGTKYSVDFMTIENEGAVSYEDVKGTMTKETARNLKQVHARYGVKVKLLKYDYRRGTFAEMPFRFPGATE